MIKLSTIKTNPNNPRVIKDDKFKKLCDSIEKFPRMLELRPIIIDDDNIVLGGNMRLKALQHLGHKEIPESWIKRASDFTEEEKKEFLIKDNVGFGEWNWDELANDFDLSELSEWGMDVPGLDFDGTFNESEPYQNKFKVVVNCENQDEATILVKQINDLGYKAAIS